MRRALVLLLIAVSVLVLAPAASSEPPAVCGSLTGRQFAQTHIREETPGHVPGTHRGCAGFPG